MISTATSEINHIDTEHCWLCLGNRYTNSAFFFVLFREGTLHLVLDCFVDWVTIAKAASSDKVPLGILAASETEALSSMSPSGGPFRRLGLGFRSGNCVRIAELWEMSRRSNSI